MSEIQMKKSVAHRSKLVDWLAKWVITIGGVCVIVAVIGILLLIVQKTLPLFGSASAEVIFSEQVPEEVARKRILATGIEMSPDEKFVLCYFLCADGRVHIMNVKDREVLDEPDIIQPPEDSPDAQIAQIEPFGGDDFSILWDDGSTSLVTVHLLPKYNDDGERVIEHSVATRQTVAAPQEGKPVLSRIRMDSDGAATRAALLPDNRIHIYKQSITSSMFGGSETTESTFVIPAEGINGTVTAMTMTMDGSILFAGTENGQIIRWALSEDGEPSDTEYVDAFADGRTITSLGMVFGDVSLAVGDSKGGMTTWFRIRTGTDGTDGWELSKIHTLTSHESPVRAIVSSRRNKGLMSLNEDGRLHLDHMTSERSMLQIAADQPIRIFSYAPRGNALVAIDNESELFVWRLDNPHPETSWKTLFWPVHYEGYPEPDLVWQTTGDEDFEAKFSLVPLLFGTFKGTLYAMLFSVPLALFGALYVSQFTSHEMRAWIKPVVEIMAAVPSVVIGFLAALWLAPIVKQSIVAVFLVFVTIPLAFAAFMLIWAAIRHMDWAKRVERGYEFIALLPCVVAGAYLAILLAPYVEGALFQVDMGGDIGMVPDFKLWIFQHLDLRYDPRNCIIIAFALGFAVIPIIFSIAEDSLTNVPRSLAAASLALGASRWQTVWRVVLPSASPGIFAAIMIGFGRAIGETMIVLMATGNTPIIDLSPFNGMRTLSANIAVEIPEAPVDGTLYRTLFLCAVLLFCLTFLLNTVAEIVRDRLRRKYGRF